MENYFAQLNISPHADAEQIRRAIKHAAETRTLPLEVLQQIQQTLLNPDKRRDYEIRLRQEIPDVFTPPAIPQPSTLDHKRSKKIKLDQDTRLILIILGALGLLTLLLPWVSLDGGLRGSRMGIAFRHVWIPTLVFAVYPIRLLLPSWQNWLSSRWMLIAPAVLVLIGNAQFLVRYRQSLNHAGGIFAERVALSYGFYLHVLLATAIVAVVLYRVRKS